MSCSQARSGCLECNNNISTALCLNCSSNLILFQGSCLVSCPSGYTLDSVDKKCIVKSSEA